jgi:1-acyl-sn-glycerol-3-phosphate acyltransferase
VARRREPIYTLAKTLVPPVVKTWVDLDCRGFTELPATGPVIVAANHVSYFDPLCVGTAVNDAGRVVRFLAKSELFANPVLGAVLRGAGQIPVKRHTREARVALEAAVTALEDGAAVVVYPEGTTTVHPDFSPMPAKSGVARLALLTGAPVLPVGQWGSHLLFAQGRIGPFRRGIPVVIQAGPLLQMPRLPDAPRTEVKLQTERIMTAIAEQVALAKKGWSAPRWYRPKAPRSPKPRARVG